MTSEDARLSARRAFGGVEQTKDLQRDAGSFIWLDDARRDVQHAARLLARNPLFALTAALSLAIGIGASTTIFTVANGLLLNAAPGLAEPDQLVDIVRSEKGRFGVSPSSYADYQEIRQRVTTLDSVYAYQLDLEPTSMRPIGDASAERIFATFVTMNYFSALGVRPAAGRLLAAGEGDEPVAASGVVLSHRFWTRRFNADPAIVGQTLPLNGHPCTVVGIAAEAFRGTSVVAPDVWVPIAGMELLKPGRAPLGDRWSTRLMLGARLKPHLVLGQAAAEMDAIGRALAAENPSDNGETELRLAAASPIPANLRLVVAAFLALLMALVSLVLLIACANLAGVLLARATARRREIAVRLAMGAGRARLVRQLLTETLILFLLGGVAGLVLARVITSLLLLLLPAFPVPLNLSLPLDGRVIVFAAGLSWFAALLSGLAPALHASRADVVSALKDESQGSADRLRLRSTFVVAQVALSILLVIAAGLLGRGLEGSRAIGRGFDPQGVELASLELSLAGYTDTTGPIFVRALVDRIRGLRDVKSATAAVSLPGGPVRRQGTDGGLSVPGAPSSNAFRFLDADVSPVESGYFATLRIPLVAGRDFSAADRTPAQPVAIVSETAAKRFWPDLSGQDVIGRQLRWQAGRPGMATAVKTLLVVGVARDLKYRGRGDEPRSIVYVPFQQRYVSGVTIVARSSHGQRIAGEIRTVLASMNPNVPVMNSETLENLMMRGPVLTQLRVAASVSGSIGIVGLLLAAIGIYGVTAYAVTRRTREIGVRVAMGAQRADVLGMVLRQGMSLVAIGAAVGCGLAIGAGRVLAKSLIGVPPIDPVIFAVATVLFALVGFAACLVPALRATQIDAMDALRHE